MNFQNIDYNKILSDRIYGNYKFEPKQEDWAYMDGMITITDNLQNAMNKVSSGYTIDTSYTKYLQGTNNYNVFYVCGTQSGSSNLYPFFLVFDESMNFKFGKKMETNVVCKDIHYDEENRIYGAFGKGETTSSSPTSFSIIMYNNMAVENKIENLITYNLALTSSYNRGDIHINKQLGGSHYLIYGGDNESNYILTDYEVNVGGTNNLTQYKYTEIEEEQYFTESSGNVIWSTDGKFTFNAICVMWDGTLSTMQDIHTYPKLLRYSSGKFTTKDIIEDSTRYYMQTHSMVYQKDATTSYLFDYHAINPASNDVYKIVRDSNLSYSMKLLAQIDAIKPITEASLSNTIIIGEHLFNACIVAKQTSSGKNDIYLSIINIGDNDSVTWIPFTKILQEQSSTNLFCCFNYANDILNIQILSNSATKIWQVLYNSSTYNGVSYIAINTLIPDKLLISDGTSYRSFEDDANIPYYIYASPLYNLQINKNNIVAEWMINHDKLNNKEIKDLYVDGQTATDLIASYDNITHKNEYESLMIIVNFINTVINKNNPNISKTNQLASTYLSKGIYNKDTNIKMTKMRLVKEDGSYRTDNMTSSIEYLNNEDLTIITYKAIIYNNSSNPYKHWLFMSEDEKAIYADIDLSSLEGDKIYTLSQKVSIAPEGEIE